MQNNQKIPEGWNIVFLNSLSSKGIMNGIFNNPTKVGKGVPLINVVDLYNDKIDINRLSLLDVSEDELKRYEAITGDLLFTRSSLKLEGIAQCNIVPTKNSRCVFDCHIMRIRPNDQLVVPYYLFAYCNTAIAKIQFMKLSKTTTMTTIDQDGLGQLKVLLPPLEEQEKIAGILGTWDEAIEKLSSLIEQKKLLKKGLMQRLLTGKTRLKSFTQPWKEVKLGEVLFEHSQKSCENEAVCSVSVHKGVVNQVEHLGRSFSAANTSNYNLVHYGDVIYTKSPTGDFPYGIFKQSQQKSNIIVSPLYGVFTPKSYALGYILDSYFSYPVNMNNYLKPIIQKGAKNTINITNKTFLSKSLCLPTNIAEQKAIADVLSTADEEIDLLNKKLETLKEQKKGLMQQLLTGQTRVKVN